MRELALEIEQAISGLGDRPGLCLYYAKETIAVFARHGYKAVIQAGSLQWPCLCPEDDDGVISTHFAYMWSPGDFTSAFSVALGNLPEMHCWVGLLEEQEIVDFSIRHLKTAAAIHGVKWTAADPPPYFWCHVNEIPDDVRYIPNREASIYASIILERLVSQEVQS
ncbi:MAG: hypothetical protein WC919_01150 [Candidatus Paceibacterota bacterium]|jgi:hypothetical protein